MPRGQNRSSKRGIELSVPIELRTKFGKLEARHFLSAESSGVVILKRVQGSRRFFVRPQSSCVFSEAFGANDCDCVRQLQASLSLIGRHGGCCIYEFAEARGMGLRFKFEVLAYARRNQVDTAKAFDALGAQRDPRTFATAVAICRELDIPQRICVGSDNPKKLNAFKLAGYDATRRVLKIRQNSNIRQFRKEMQRELGHFA